MIRLVAMILCITVAFLAAHPAAAVIEPTGTASIVHLVVAALGGVVALSGVVLAFRRRGTSAEITISLPGDGKLVLSRVGQGIALAVVGGLILLGSLYLSPTRITETTTVHGPEGETQTRARR